MVCVGMDECAPGIKERYQRRAGPSLGGVRYSENTWRQAAP